MTEIWLPIPGWGSKYEVSDTGHVRNIFTGRTIGSIDSTGYPYVMLFDRGKRKHQRIHQLVAELFLGPCPDGQEVRHLDDIKTHNDISNLKYGTRSQNLLDRVTLGAHHQARKTHCKQGHEYTEENTYRFPDGRRDCYICRRRRKKEEYALRLSRR